MVPKISDSKLDFRMKLLSGNNVVMVEADGYEAEIFMPQMLGGRISFQNIIPNRRCCSLAIGSGSRVAKSFRNTVDSAPSDRFPLGSATNSRAWRIHGGHDNYRSNAPVATSTPSTTVADKENLRAERRVEVVQSSNLSTPETVRKAATHQMVKDTLVQIPSGVKVIRLYRDRTPNTPKRVGRVVGTSNSNISIRNNASNNVNNLSTSRIAEVPIIHATPESKRRDNNSPQYISKFRITSTPEVLAAGKKSKETHSSLRQNKAGSATKWRKCITPARTYSRRQLQKSTAKSNAKKPAFNTSAARMRRILSHNELQGKVVPTYLVNPTQAIKSDVKVEVKKRKLIIDPKISISPSTFKRQQSETADLEISREFKLPRTRKEYEAVKHSAFDMLTNSNRVHRMSPKLNEQFRKACVNKKCATYKEYKNLCVLPPLDDTAISDREEMKETQQKSSAKHTAQNNK